MDNLLRVLTSNWPVFTLALVPSFLIALVRTFRRPANSVLTQQLLEEVGRLLLPNALERLAQKERVTRSLPAGSAAPDPELTRLHEVRSTVRLELQSLQRGGPAWANFFATFIPNLIYFVAGIVITVFIMQPH
jgi:hypothetical protein